MTPLGDELLKLLRGRQDIVLAAPFIKTHVMRRVLAELDEAATLTVFTRWRLEEIAAGVADLSVYPLLKGRPRTALRLAPNLHAKYFRADESCLIGSANLTGAALGWANPVNLELLIAAPAAEPTLKAFEWELMACSLEADEALYEALARALQELPPPPTVERLMSDAPDPSGAGPIRFEAWRPALRHPSDLFRAYRGSDDLTAAARHAAARDLAALDLPLGLSEATFDLAVASRLLQHPEAREIDRFVAEPRRFGEVRRLLTERGAEDGDLAWQTWMRWLLKFLPQRYAASTPNYSEIFRRL